jgi:hypothetical protein
MVGVDFDTAVTRNGSHENGESDGHQLKVELEVETDERELEIELKW